MLPFCECNSDWIGQNIQNEVSLERSIFEVVVVYQFNLYLVTRGPTIFPDKSGRLKVTRPSFFGGYHPTLKLSGIPTFTFIVSLTHRMDNI